MPDIVELCVSTDEDVLRIAAELLPSLHPGARFCREPRVLADGANHASVAELRAERAS